MEIIKEQEESLDELVVRARRDHALQEIIDQSRTPKNYLVGCDKLDFNDDSGIDISESGAQFAGTLRYIVELNTKHDGNLSREFITASRETKDVALTSDAAYLAVSTEQSVEIYETKKAGSREVFCSLDIPFGNITHLAFSHSGNYLAGVDDYYVTVAHIDYDSKKAVLMPKAVLKLSEQIRGISFTSHIDYLTVALSNRIQFYKIHAGEFELSNTLNFVPSINDISTGHYHDDFQLAIASDDGCARVYRYHSDELKEIICQKVCDGPLKRIALSRNGDYLLTPKKLFRCEYED
jgi:WD40 repeat protein